jgi:rubrerythrin
MARQKYVCMKCGYEFAVRGAEEPEECPECESDDVENVDQGMYGNIIEELDFTPRRYR